MAAAGLLGAVGLAAGFLLLLRIPTCSSPSSHALTGVTVIIPARNEEQNLPNLLRSLTTSTTLKIEILVVDDHSTDNTAEVARAGGAGVLQSQPLPAAWTGKAWACYQGAQNARQELLLFLDADTHFTADGLDRLMSRWASEDDAKAIVSLLPHHAMRAPYEQLSLFFNLLMASGAGGFGLLGGTRLFGQCLLLRKESYFSVNGHAAVRSFVLENLHLARLLENAGHRLLCLGGRGTLEMRMFPDGFRQMSDSWTKAFADGASASGAPVLALSALWIACLWTAAILLALPTHIVSLSFALAYLLLSAQLLFLARQLGNYSFATCLFYPLPLLYYCAIFARSALRHLTGQKTVWRGREV